LPTHDTVFSSPPGRTIAISDGVLSERIEAGHA
jgi:hypothetical protein